MLAHWGVILAADSSSTEMKRDTVSYDFLLSVWGLVNAAHPEEEEVR